LAQVYAFLTFALVGLPFIIGGIHVIRNGFEVTKNKRLVGPPATFIGIALIVLGALLPVAWTVWTLWFFRKPH
jgi:hypothetical protein